MMSLPGLAPIVVLIVLLELAVGTLVVTYAVDLLGEVGRGFLASTAVICAAIVVVELGIAAILPDPSLLLHQHVDGGAVASMFHWTIGLLAGVLLYALLGGVGTDGARRVMGALALGIGLITIERTAVAFGEPMGGSAAALVAFLPAALLDGAALAGMLLGHWYLISPDLSFRPLRRAVYTIFLAIAVQAVTIIAVLLASAGAGRGDLVGTRYGAPFWLLVIGSGIVFTAAVNGLTLYFARIRANQPATAMLYVLIITVLMGTVPAHLLAFLTRLPV